jgi:hypothetical protein
VLAGIKADVSVFRRADQHHLSILRNQLARSAAKFGAIQQITGELRALKQRIDAELLNN